MLENLSCRKRRFVWYKCNCSLVLQFNRESDTNQSLSKNEIHLMDDYYLNSNALANTLYNAMSDWITSEICDSIFHDIYTVGNQTS